MIAIQVINRVRVSRADVALIFVPLPFVVALLLLVLLAALWRQKVSAANPPFLVLIVLCIVQSILLGLRWGYNFDFLRHVLPVMAGCVPPLVFLSFRSLIGRDGVEPRLPRWLHAAPPFVLAVLVLAAPGLIDPALILLFVGYAFAVFGLGRAGPDALEEARLDEATPAYRALLFAVVSLCVSALFDLVVLLDFAWSQGANARLIVTNGNLLWLLFIGITALVASRATPQSDAAAVAGSNQPDAEQDRDILARVDRLLVQQKLFRDDNLTLARLGRRASLPARHISGAINRLAGKNVSQYINDIRVAEACRLLRETEMSVTAAMFDSGFQTKSNFNREFRRVTSLNPAAWREKNRS